MRASRVAQVIAGVAATMLPALAAAQERLPWQQDSPRAPSAGAYAQSRPNDAYTPPQGGGGGAYGGAYRGDGYRDPDRPDPRYSAPPPSGPERYGRPYGPPPGAPGAEDGPEPFDPTYGSAPPSSGPYPPPRDDYGPGPRYAENSYSENEILSTGHRFFGSVSKGLAGVVEYAFRREGRPNGYILGEDAGGAFVAGLRYGEGVLHTKDAGRHKVFWQGPSVGYDFGGEGSKTMVLVYHLRDPAEIYDRFGGVEGSAYFVGGVSIQFQKSGPVVLAPIRSGLGLRLGANIGYLKYTRRPTWNPF